MASLEGRPAELLREIVSDAWQTALKPLVYREAVELAAAHAAQGQPVFIVSAALQEIGDCIAGELGFDGALGSSAEARGGRFTGRLERRLLGQAKADALVDFASSECLDLSASIAYSDSHTDLPILEAVGTAVAVNPDRQLGRIAADRRWPVERFSVRAFADR
jgi:HAD superfamily hydrolase (TIGR01490 family)